MGFLQALHIGGQYLLAIALAAGGVYLALFPPGGLTALRKVGVILIGLSVVYGAVLLGEYLGREECREGHLQQQVKNKERELEIWQGGEKTAQALQDELEKQTEATQKLGVAFVKKNSARGMCALTADDLTGLRAIR